VLVLDESGDEKTGTATCGVKRQYVGCAGKVANAVNFVNATYSTPRGHALIGSRLYVPAEHLADETTRTAMGLPTDLEFNTKPQLGADLLTDALDAGVRVDWCTADAVYGRDRGLREACEKRGIGYSLGVPCSFRIRLPSGTTVRADATLQILTAGAWQTASCGPGSKGDRRYAWAWLATTSSRHFLLIRRSLSKPSELAYFYCYVPEHRPATLGALVTVTGRRWTIEEDHEFGKDQFGFDQSQARLYTPIMRHIALVTAALAVCAVTAADARTRSQPQHVPASRPSRHRPTSGRSHSPSSRSRNCSTWQPEPGDPPATICTGPGGAAAIKPAHAGTTTELDSHDQVTKYGCPTSRRQIPVRDRAERL
jgi:SRSO17 transposase